MDLSNQTPVEIDTALADVYTTVAALNTSAFHAHQRAKSLEETAPGTDESYVPERYKKRHAELFAEVRTLRGQVDRLYAEEINPREEEWVRRGRWTRYYLVDNTNGHVHKDQHCTTCFFTTQYAWLIEQSDVSAEDLVELAGEDACTVCFPWAPVDQLKKKSRLEAPERKKARLEREAKKAAQEAAKAAKAITTPEGKPLDLGKHGGKDIAKTLRAAEIAATDALYDLVREQQHSVDPEWAWYYEDGRRTTEREQADVAFLAWWSIRAIAAKKGLTFQAVFEIHEKKAQAKIKKADREWAKDFRNPNRVK